MHLPLVHKGMALTIRSKAFPGHTFHGRLDLIGDSLDPTTRTVRARGSVEDASKLLKAELYVTVEVPDPVPMSLQVPSKAVFLRENQYYLFLETGVGQFQRHAVKVYKESYPVIGRLPHDPLVTQAMVQGMVVTELPETDFSRKLGQVWSRIELLAGLDSS